MKTVSQTIKKERKRIMTNKNYWKVNTDKYNVVCEKGKNFGVIFDEMQKRVAEKTKGKGYELSKEDQYHDSYNFMGEKSLYASVSLAYKKYTVPFKGIDIEFERQIVLVNGFLHGATVDWDITTFVGNHWSILSDNGFYYEWQDNIVDECISRYEDKHGLDGVDVKGLRKEFEAIVEKEWSEGIKELDEIANSMADKQI